MIKRKSDGSFVIEFNGNPFHVTPEYPTAEQYGEEMTHACIKRYVKKHPEEVTEYVEPEPEAVPEEAVTAMRIAELEAEAQRLLPAIQAGIDAENSRQRLVECMLEIERLKGNI